MFYTYAHYIPDGSRLFYIGKGIGTRAYASVGRNKHWHNVVAKYGKPDVRILAQTGKDPNIKAIHGLNSRWLYLHGLNNG